MAWTCTPAITSRMIRAMRRNIASPVLIMNSTRTSAPTPMPIRTSCWRSKSKTALVWRNSPAARRTPQRTSSQLRAVEVEAGLGLAEQPGGRADAVAHQQVADADDREPDEDHLAHHGLQHRHEREHDAERRARGGEQE